MENDVGNSTPVFNPILRTKLHRPQLTAELVNRERLIKAMNRAHEVPLTLVSAPAGYGKSVLVAQWAERLDSPVAWLSLDASDSELRTFLLYFFAAVDTVSPGACEATRELPTAGSLAPVPALAGYLLNDLDAIDVPAAIVLDDYHRIDTLSPVHDLMLRMLEHPPRQFRFVVLTRQDPPFELPSLRAGQRINEVRVRDLRFTTQEMSEFLSATEDLTVSDEALANLEGEVEGWAAGLRLVSLALRHIGDPDAFLERPHGLLPQTQDYLLREVLGALRDRLRDLLLTSSILDRFSIELLDAICNPPDQDDPSGFTASDFLEELRRNNLFTSSLDPDDKWFRYHHLFQELLKSELQRVHGADHVSALHLRASQWFESESLIDEAIKHALAAGDMERVAQLVTRHRHAALNADQWYVLAQWLSLIPETVVQQNAELLMAQTWILLNYYFQVDAIPALLDEIESLLVDDPGDEQVRGELAASRGYILWLMGNGAESLQQVDVALERIPSEHLDFRSNTEIVFALANQMEGRKAEGLRFLDDQLAHPDSLHPKRKTRLLAARVFVYLTAGDLLEAEAANRRLSTAVEGGVSGYVRAWTNYFQGLIHLLRCEWKMAVDSLDRSVAQRFIHHRRAAVDSITGLMLAYQALGQKDKARATMQILQEYVASLGDRGMESLVISAEARLALLQGRSAPATRWLEATESAPEGAFLYWFDVASITRCRAMIAAASPDRLALAEAQLRECAAVIEAQHNTFQLIKVLALLALACDKQGRTAEALGVLERAVTMASQGNVLFPFVELGTPMVDLLHKLPTASEFTSQVERVVTSFGATGERSTAGEAGVGKPPAPQRELKVAGRTLEGLSNRELDVLELLALRLQNKEIAARLNISPQTVGSHLKQIYQKLAVQGRRQAVERALERGVLGREPAG